MMKLNIQLFGHSSQTTNYDLPQFVGTDKPTWLGDFNSAMSTIDSGMAENADDIESLGTRVTSAEGIASQASTDVAGLQSTVSTLSSNLTSVTSTANNAQSTATSALNTANSAQSTATTADGKADTLISDVGDISDLETTDKTDIVSAINELNEKNALTAYLSTNYTIPTTNVTQTLTNMSLSDYIGSKLSLVGGKVVIGAGISKVKVSYTAKTMSSANTTRTYTYLVHDKSGVPTSISQEPSFYSATNQQANVGYGPRVIDVSEGDSFYLTCNGGQGNVVNGKSGDFMETFITVESIK